MHGSGVNLRNQFDKLRVAQAARNICRQDQDVLWVMLLRKFGQQPDSGALGGEPC